MGTFTASLAEVHAASAPLAELADHFAGRGLYALLLTAPSSDGGPGAPRFLAYPFALPTGSAASPAPADASPD